MEVSAGFVLPWTTVLLSAPLKTSENSKRLWSSLTHSAFVRTTQVIYLLGD